MTMNKTKFNQLVEELRRHIHQRADHSYSVCQILYAIRSSKLYSLTGYESFREFCEAGDIGMAYSSASKHAALFAHMERLGYKKQEGVELLKEFSVTHLGNLFSEIDKKVKLSSLKRRSREWYRKHNQINFTMAPDQLEFLEAILLQHGMDYHDSGTRVNASEALIAALKQLTGARRKAA